MGVPKFYRWISERYPCLSEVVKEYQIPEFDNLYLDMNGVVHVCSHPEDDNPHFRITEEKIFQDIFHYIEVLYRMIKPKKVFFIAIDGVAPRAKMNQQRGRRFRSAREAEDLVRKALEKGETLPTEDRFDSNCITPGTPFMVKLQEQLKYFMVKKISTDKMWQGPRIFLSGHETPGEGEHTIMDFIRYERSKPNYDPNTRHCLYGLDADLMMLGLSSHEPHFALLREEVRFGGKNSQKRSTAPEETTFHLLHLSLFREYLDYEFSSLKDKLPFGYNLERIIDDWIFLGFLVGNDFIPHLPNLHIHHDALPLLWKTYKQVLPTLDGFLHDGGTLHLQRFEKYMAKLSEFDFETFADTFSDLKWLEGKTESKAAKDQANTRRREKASVSSNDAGIPTANEFLVLKNISGEDEEEYVRTAVGSMSLEEDFEEFDTDFIAAESSNLQADFRFHKDAYYSDKMKLTSSREVLQDQAECYVRGLQWILHYYFNGVPSWSWFYPYHYAPYLSDVRDFADMKMKFDLSKPFMPFQQLMAVLPSASKNLMPKALQPLMLSESSPVIDFYPQDFDLDLNGKLQEWEAVVCIPFIEEKRLIQAMKPLEEKMTLDEKARNCHSEHVLFQYNPDDQGTYHSSLPEAFPHICHHKAKVTKLDKDLFRIAPDTIFKGLCPNSRADVYFPGFPTLKHLPHSFHTARTGVKVFQMNSRGENMVLRIKAPEIEAIDLELVAKEYIGRVVHIDWPQLLQAKVVAASDVNEMYHLKEDSSRRRSGSQHEIEMRRENLDRDASKVWCKEVETLTQRYKERKGVDIGDTDILLYAVPLVGRKYVHDHDGKVVLEKQWSSMPIPYALQTVVKDIDVQEPEFEVIKDLSQLFPLGEKVFMLGQPYYGCMGEVMNVEQNEGRVRVQFTQNQEPDLSFLVNKKSSYETEYLLGYQCAKRLGISSFLVSRITGVLYMRQGGKEHPAAHNSRGMNIALNLKFNKTNKMVPGYTKKSDQDNKQWLYSSKVVTLIHEYIKTFPELFDRLSCIGDNEDLYEEDIFGEEKSDEKVRELKKYLKTVPCASVPPADFGTEVLDDPVVQQVEAAADRTRNNNRRVKRAKMQVKSHLLYRPMEAQTNLIPDPSATYELLDRVVNVREGYSVPVGLRGTVIGILPAPKEQDNLYEVVFDEEIIGGLTIRCSPNKGYRLPPSALINITHGNRKTEEGNTWAYKPTAVVKPLLGQNDHYSPRQGDRDRDRKYQQNFSQSGSNQANRVPHQYQKAQLPNKDFLPHWLKPPTGSAVAQPSASYHSLMGQQPPPNIQQLSQAGAGMSYQQFKQQQQHGSGLFQFKGQQSGYQQGTPLFQLRPQRFIQGQPGEPSRQSKSMDSTLREQESSRSQPVQEFGNIWSQLQGSNTTSNMPQTWQNSKIPPPQPLLHKQQQQQQQQQQPLLPNPNAPSLTDAAKALPSHSQVSPVEDPQQHQQQGASSGVGGGGSSGRTFNNKNNNKNSGYNNNRSSGSGGGSAGALKHNHHHTKHGKHNAMASGPPPSLLNIDPQSSFFPPPLMGGGGGGGGSMPLGGMPFDVNQQVDMTKLFSVPPPPLPNPAGVGRSSGNAAMGSDAAAASNLSNDSIDDFNRLMAALQTESNGQDLTGNDARNAAKEGTQALQQLLKMNKNSPPKSKPQDQPYGRQLSVQDLFKGAAQSESVPSGENQKHSAPKQNNQQQEQRKRNPVGELLTYCMNMGMIAPRYDYTQGADGKLSCLVTLTNGDQYKGSFAKDRRQAMDSAASNALNNLQQQSQDPGFQRNMPGIFGSNLPNTTAKDDTTEEESHHLVASPNSAFSPFKGPGPFDSHEVGFGAHKTTAASHYGQPFPNPPHHHPLSGTQPALLHTHLQEQQLGYGSGGNNQLAGSSQQHLYHHQSPKGQQQGVWNYSDGSGRRREQQQQQGYEKNRGSGRQRIDSDKDVEVKKENQFVPMQVFKKQKTPAKTESKTDIKDTNTNSELNTNNANGNVSNEPLASAISKSVTEVKSETPPKSKKQIHFEDVGKEKEKEVTKPKEQKAAAASKTEKEGGEKKQPKRPRSRLAAKFN